MLPLLTKLKKKLQNLIFLFVLALFFLLSFPNNSLANSNHLNMLNSWNEGNVKQSIINFVDEVTNPESGKFVAPENRIAVFDNDGTLWTEKPTYFQLFFIVSRIKELSLQHPEWQNQQPFQAILTENWQYLQTIKSEKLIELMMITHTGMTQTEFAQQVQNFFTTAKHPRWQKLYTELVFQPMLELLDYLKRNDFQVYICSAGGRDFMREIPLDVYGIPKENIIGSTINKKFIIEDNQVKFMRLPEITKPVNNYQAKPINIEREIGKKPILAVGNSDGDIAMMEYTTIDHNPSLAILIHHDDSDREYSYIKGTEKALNLAKKYGWKIVSMKKEFKQIYPWENN